MIFAGSPLLFIGHSPSSLQSHQHTSGVRGAGGMGRLPFAGRGSEEKWQPLWLEPSFPLGLDPCLLSALSYMYVYTHTHTHIHTPLPHRQPVMPM